MKLMKVLRGSARGLRRGVSPMARPSVEAQAAMLADQKAADRKMSFALFNKHGTAHMPF